MAVKIIEVGTVLVTVWGNGSPTSDDVDTSLLAAQMFRSRVGRPLTLIGVMSPGTKMPTDDVRDRMVTQWPKLLEACSSVQYVNLTTSFVASRLISLIVRVFAFTTHGRSIQIHSDVNKALDAAVLADPLMRQHTVEVQRAISKALREFAATPKIGVAS